MAKAKTLDQAITKVVMDYSNSLEKAAKYATKKAESDIYDYSMSFLQEYYYEFLPDTHEPKWYERSNSLKHAFFKFSNVRRKGTLIECEAGIEYSALALEQYVGANNNYAYDASKKYGQVDAEWVLDNYLHGLHPTYGSTTPGAKNYYEGYSPTLKMKMKLSNYGPIFQKNLLLSFANQVVDIMRR